MYKIVYALAGGILIAGIIVGNVKAEDKTYIHPTQPGTTVRDWSKPSTVIEGDRVYQTYPGSTLRDYTQPEYIIEQDNTHKRRYQNERNN